ncbi:ATP synthase mitochondrial F1 complex assembly factor 2 [Microbotryomycetes sp. JL221]|nr:ATP synthase mitochondrial F1 complex assembly factor 2 [Microbotryomycetes sp. JL221]
MFARASRNLTLQSWTHTTTRSLTTCATRLAVATSDTQTNRAEKMMRRFWKQVAIDTKPDGTYAVLLDKRTLKTPGGKLLSLPKEQLPIAVLIADEWENQLEVLKPHTLPMTSIYSRAIDGLSDESTRKSVVEYLLKYLDTDTICFHEEFPQTLVKLQDDHWKPLIAWIEQTYDVKIKVYDGILGTRQSDATVVKLGAVVGAYDQFKLAAFERAVLASKSYLIALGLVEGFLSVEQAAMAAHVEVQSQIDKWGEVEDTHDVDHQDVRVRLGSAAMLVSKF